MATKRASRSRNRGQKAQDSRRAEKDVAFFTSAADRLGILKSELTALVDVMRELKIDKVRMDGATKFDRGLVEIGAFVTHARRALDVTKMKRLTG